MRVREKTAAAFLAIVLCLTQDGFVERLFDEDRKSSVT